MVHRRLILVREIVQMEQSVEALAHTDDFLAALNTIDQARKVLDRNLKGVKSLCLLSERLNNYEQLIAERISDQLVTIIGSSQWDFDYSCSLLNSTSSNKENEKKKSRLKEEMRQAFSSLLRMNCIGSTIKKYRASLIEEIKIVVKAVVNETNSVASDFEESIESTTGGTFTQKRSSDEKKIAEKLKALTSEQFLSCLYMIFEHLLIILKRVAVVQELIIEHVAGLKSEMDASEDSVTERVILEDSDEVVRKACSFSQNSVSNLFAVRKELRK